MNLKTKTSTKILNEKNISPSFQRISVLEYLQNSHGHPTVDEIYHNVVKKIPTLSKTTVYNILKLFNEKNIVNVIRIGDNEARYDCNTKVHGHFKCKKCGNIYDFDVDLEKLEFKGLDNFIIKEYQIYLKGICEKCIP